MSTTSIESATQRPSSAAAWINVVMIPLAILEVVLVLGDVHSTIRVWLAVALFCLGPGSGLVQFLKLTEPAMQVGVLVAISASVDLILGQSLLWAHNFSATAAICIIAGITCVRPVGRSSRTIGGQA
jgi:hypothetical protein